MKVNEMRQEFFLKISQTISNKNKLKNRNKQKKINNNEF